MKTWVKPEIYSVDLSKTAHDWALQRSLDGGYLGDGTFSGWFGQPETPAATNNAVADAAPSTPAAPVVLEPAVDAVDELS